MPYMKSGTNLLFDNTTGDVVGMRDPDGSDLYFARAPYTGAWFDLSDQPCSANTATAMEFDTKDFAFGISVVSNTRITFPRTSVYNVQFSAQFKNVNNTSEQNISVWLAKGGSNLANTNTELTIPRKHGGGDGLLVAAWNFFVSVNAGEYVEIYWSSPSADVSIEYKAEQVSPARPATPSVILTVSEVDGNNL